MSYQPPQPGQPASPQQPGQPAQPAAPTLRAAPSAQAGQPTPQAAAQPNYQQGQQPAQPAYQPAPGYGQASQPAQQAQPSGALAGLGGQQTQNPYGAPTVDPSMRDSQVDTSVLQVLHGTKGWVRFVSVLLFIIVGFGLLGVLGSFASPVHKIIPLIQLIILGLYFFPALKLSQFASGITKLMMNPTSISLVEALDKQRVFWKFVGIILIISIGLFVVMIIALMSMAARVSNGF